MALVTIQVLEGVERGRIYADLPTPVTIGREDDNAIRLNDERVSRFHAKIQEDGGRLIFTDLDSTNGSRVNGRPVQMKVLSIGDQLLIGRCLLIFGSNEEIASEAAELARRRREASPAEDQTLAGGPTSGSGHGAGEADSSFATESQLEELFPGGPPECPGGLTPLQRAQISDQFAFMHEQIRKVIEAAYESDEDAEAHEREMRIAWTAWQHLVHLEMNLAITLRRMADPDA